MEVHGGHLGFLTGDLEKMGILDIMDDLILQKGGYSVHFVSRMWCQEGRC